MFKRKLNQSDFLLIAANMLPVIGCWFYGLSPAEVFIVYALETIIAGFFTLLKMGIVTAVRKTDTWYNKGSSSNVSGLFFMLFFIFHYGIFVAVQTGIFIEVSGIGKQLNLSFFAFLSHWPNYFNGNLLYMLFGFIVSYGFNLIWNFIRTKQYQTISMIALMFQPYGRIFVQQFTVILGSTFLAFGADKIFILIFATIKILFEVFVDYENILNKRMDEMKKESGKQ